MTIRLSIPQAHAYKRLSYDWQTPAHLGTLEVTLDALVRLGYAEKKEGIPPQYKKGNREL